MIETENGAKALGKPVGTYVTIEAPNMSSPDEDYHREISQEIAEHLQKLLGDRRRSVLVVGLGLSLIHILPVWRATGHI